LRLKYQETSCPHRKQNTQKNEHMDTFKHFFALERLDQLIRAKATGSAQELADRLNVSKRTVFYLLAQMRDMGAPIQYCHTRQSYYYAEECRFEFRCEFILSKDEQRRIEGRGFAPLRPRRKVYSKPLLLTTKLKNSS
jgi:hypothetical protein